METTKASSSASKSIKLNDLKFVKEIEWLYQAYLDYSKVIGTTADTLKPIEERNLEYRDGAVGITELLGCPIKAKLRRKYKDDTRLHQVDSLAIAEGFYFENIVKRLLVNKFGEQFCKPEFVLTYDYTLQLDENFDHTVQFKIDGHLDVLVEYYDPDDKSDDARKPVIVGIELKSTIINFNPDLEHSASNNNSLFILEPNDRTTFVINRKYFQQVKIQRYILRKLYPDHQIETYLLINTPLQTKWSFTKAWIVLPVTEDLTDEEFENICRSFILHQHPKMISECAYCKFKQYGYCNGYSNREIEQMLFSSQSLVAQSDRQYNNTVDWGLSDEQKAYIKQLVERYHQLKSEIASIENYLKKNVSEPFEYAPNRYVGWESYTFQLYNVNEIARRLIEQGYTDFASIFEVKRGATKKLKELLGIEFDLIKTPVKRKRFRFK